MIGAFAGGLAQGVGQGLDIYGQLQRVSEDNRKRDRVAGAIAAVAGVTALDILCAVLLSRDGRR